jgi:DNA-binding response OmpR family regulator
MNAIAGAQAGAAEILLIGADRNQIVEKRLQAAGCHVMRSSDGPSALNIVRHRSFNTAVLLSKGSLLNAAETVLNLRDLNRSLEIIVLVDRRAKDSNRFLRQLLEHPIDGTKIMTRRQLQRCLHGPGSGVRAHE